DPGEGRLADWPVVPRALHAAGYLISVTPHRVQPADAGPPCRRAGREGHRRVAHRDLGEGSRIAAATGAWICFEDEAGRTLRPPKGPHLGTPRPYPGGDGVQQGLGAGFGGRHGLPTPRHPGTAVLSGPPAPGT